MPEQLSFVFTAVSFKKEELALLTPEDIYANADAELLTELKEDRRLERKPASIHGAELGTYYCMWANTIGGGLMVLGQEDKGEFSGVLRLSQGDINSIEKAGEAHCPDAYIQHRRVPVTLPNGDLDYVLLVYVHYHEKRVVRDVRGKVYRRSGDSREEVKNPEKIRAMEIEKGQIDLELEPVDLKFPDDFNLALVRSYLDGVVRLKRIETSHTEQEILCHGRLGKIRNGAFVPNRACALLFANDPVILFPGCKMRIQRFNGDVEQTGKNYNLVKEFFIEGTIPEIIVGASRTLREQLREFSRLGQDERFYTAPEYPPEAWLEVIVNACVHRSYHLKNMQIFVKIFDDHLEVTSPGGFPDPVTPENIYNTHSPRNPHLMNALFFMNFVRLSNEGTRRIRDTMGEMNLPSPEFAQKEVAMGFDSVRVTLRNNIKLRTLWVDSAADQTLKIDIRNLTPQEIRIVNYVAEYNNINVTQAQRLLSPKRWQAAKRVLVKLVEKGVLEHNHDPDVLRDASANFTMRRTS
jgi:ATP-dependent DNA helicase RecG